MYMYMQVYICIYAYMYVYACMCIYIYIYSLHIYTFICFCYFLFVCLFIYLINLFIYLFYYFFLVLSFSLTLIFPTLAKTMFVLTNNFVLIKGSTAKTCCFQSAKVLLASSLSIVAKRLLYLFIRTKHCISVHSKIYLLIHSFIHSIIYLYNIAIKFQMFLDNYYYILLNYIQALLYHCLQHYLVMYCLFHLYSQ